MSISWWWDCTIVLQDDTTGVFNGHKGSLWIISYNCVRIHNYLKSLIFKKGHGKALLYIQIILLVAAILSKHCGRSMVTFTLQWKDCGLCHLKPWVRHHWPHIRYVNLDSLTFSALFYKTLDSFRGLSKHLYTC